MRCIEFELLLVLSKDEPTSLATERDMMARRREELDYVVFDGGVRCLEKKVGGWHRKLRDN